MLNIVTYFRSGWQPCFNFTKVSRQVPSNLDVCMYRKYAWITIAAVWMQETLEHRYKQDSPSIPGISASLEKKKNPQEMFQLHIKAICCKSTKVSIYRVIPHSCRSQDCCNEQDRPPRVITKLLFHPRALWSGVRAGNGVRSWEVAARVRSGRFNRSD